MLFVNAFYFVHAGIHVRNALAEFLRFKCAFRIVQNNQCFILQVLHSYLSDEVKRMVVGCHLFKRQLLDNAMSDKPVNGHRPANNACIKLTVLQ